MSSCASEQAASPAQSPYSSDYELDSSEIVPEQPPVFHPAYHAYLMSRYSSANQTQNGIIGDHPGGANSHLIVTPHTPSIEPTGLFDGAKLRDMFETERRRLGEVIATIGDGPEPTLSPPSQLTANKTYAMEHRELLRIRVPEMFDRLDNIEREINSVGVAKLEQLPQTMPKDPRHKHIINEIKSYDDLKSVLQTRLKVKALVRQLWTMLGEDKGYFHTSGAVPKSIWPHYNSKA